MKSFLFQILFLLTALIASLNAFAREPVLLEKINLMKQAVVTVKGEIIDAQDPTQVKLSLDTRTGRIVKRSRARIGMQQKIGAGVIIDPNGIITTNTHILFGSQFVIVETQNKEKYRAKIIYISPLYDFSLLQIIPKNTLTAITWADFNDIQLGKDIITIGHSPLLEETISGGTIKAIGIRKTSEEKTAEFIQININHYKGDSGGPVFDTDGNFLGLMNAKHTKVEKTVFAIPANKIYSAYLNIAPKL